MPDVIALASAAAPSTAPAAAAAKGDPPQAKQHAVLDLYKAEKADGGSKRGTQIGKIPFQFNPKEITISKSAKWDRKPAKGNKKAGPPEFSGAEPCKLTLEMFFDAVLQRKLDVVQAVEQLFSCCVPVDEKAPKPMPPLVVLTWGGISSFNAFVTQVSAKYTLFSSAGVPIRAVCTVNLEEMPGEPRKQNPSSGARAARRVHRFGHGDRLALLAHSEYGDPTMWRKLAAYNDFDDPMRIRPGTPVVLPAIEELG